MKKTTVKAYDTIKRKYVDVEVSDKVRTYYNRTGWNIDDNDESFYEHEIQFSALIGGENGAFENFHEFVTDVDVTERKVLQKIMYEKLYECLNALTDEERELINMIFFEKLTFEECGKRIGITHQAVSKRKDKILCKLHELLK